MKAQAEGQLKSHKSESLSLYPTVLQIPDSGFSWANGSKNLLENVQVMVLPSGNRTQAQDRRAQQHRPEASHVAYSL